MDQNFKLSLLEMVILLKLHEKDTYGYDLTQEVYEILSLKEGIVFPFITKLKNDKKIESYINEMDQDPKIVYKLTALGKLTCEQLIKKYKNITYKIEELMKGFELYE